MGVAGLIGLILLVALLGVMLYCAQMLLPLITPAEPLMTILRGPSCSLLGFFGIHVPVPWVLMTAAEP